MEFELKTKKAMSTDEVVLLLDLIESNPIILSKETNATTNKSKEEAWTRLACSFNAGENSLIKNKDQLKFKWDNLKKAARKRAEKIKLFHLRTGSSKFIPPDEILDRVLTMLGSKYSIEPPSGDGQGCDVVKEDSSDSILSIASSEVTEDVGTCSKDTSKTEKASDPTPSALSTEGPTPFTNRPVPRQLRKMNPAISPIERHLSTGPGATGTMRIIDPSNGLAAYEIYQNSPYIIDKNQVSDCKKINNGSRARNLAIQRYYEAKTRKINLEIEILKMALEEKQKKLNNIK